MGSRPPLAPARRAAPPAGACAVLAAAIVAEALAGGCVLFRGGPDVGDLSAPLAAARAYEELPAARRDRAAFLTFWIPSDRRLLSAFEGRLARIQAAFEDLRIVLAARFPDRGLRSYGGGLAVRLGGEVGLQAGEPRRDDEIFFPLEAVSLAEVYAAAPRREIEFGRPTVIGEGCILPMRMPTGDFELSLRRVKGRWLRALAPRERLLLVAQHNYLDAVEAWIDGIRGDLAGGRLDEESFEAMFRSYRERYLALARRYKGAR